MLQTNKALLQRHFNRSELTRHNPAMALTPSSGAYLGRKGAPLCRLDLPLLGLPGPELLHLQRHSLEDFLDGIVELDPFLIHPHYCQLIEAVNPLSSGFEKQFRPTTSKKATTTQCSRLRWNKRGFDHKAKPARNAFFFGGAASTFQKHVNKVPDSRTRTISTRWRSRRGRKKSRRGRGPGAHRGCRTGEFLLFGSARPQEQKEEEDPGLKLMFIFLS